MHIRPLILLLALALTGCSVLPHGENKVISKWSSFDEAMEAYEEIVPYLTTLEELEPLGFSPGSQPNVRILNHAEIIDRLVAVQDGAMDGLPQGLCDCLALGDECYGHEIKLRVTNDKRYGNVFADLLNFKRKVETRGWEFNALIVIIADVVVYKTWSGTPEILEYSDTTNPLGPLQSINPTPSF